MNIGMAFFSFHTYSFCIFIFYLYVSKTHYQVSIFVPSVTIFSFYLKHIHLYWTSLTCLILKVLSYCLLSVYIHFCFHTCFSFWIGFNFLMTFLFLYFSIQFRDYNMYPWLTKVLKLLIQFIYLSYPDLSTRLARLVYFNSIFIKIIIHNFWSFVHFNI